METDKKLFRPSLTDMLTSLVGVVAFSLFFVIGLLLIFFSGYHVLSLGFVAIGGLGAYSVSRGCCTCVLVTPRSLFYRSTPFFPGGYSVEWSDVISWSASYDDNDVSIPFVCFTTSRSVSRHIYSRQVSNPGFDSFVSLVNERLPGLRSDERAI